MDSNMKVGLRRAARKTLSAILKTERGPFIRAVDRAAVTFRWYLISFAMEKHRKRIRRMDSGQRAAHAEVCSICREGVDSVAT